MYLIDSNIFLEILLEQEKSELCKNFLSEQDPSSLFISRFSLYSIGILLFNKRKSEIFNKFIAELVENINVINLELDSLTEIKNIQEQFNLDFDDSYQYLVAKKLNLKIVSFDKDFKNTGILINAQPFL